MAVLLQHAGIAVPQVVDVGDQTPGEWSPFLVDDLGRELVQAPRWRPWPEKRQAPVRRPGLPRWTPPAGWPSALQVIRRRRMRRPHPRLRTDERRRVSRPGRRPRTVDSTRSIHHPGQRQPYCPMRHSSSARARAWQRPSCVKMQLALLAPAATGRAHPECAESL